MSGFYYNGHSTANILQDLSGEELLLVSADGMVDRVTGVERESVEGDPTISRPIVNEYGTNAEHLTFTYALMKRNGEDYSPAEQRLVEKWLTSPKFSSDLTLFDCDGVEFMHYYGKFTTTEWLVHENFLAVIFTFTVNGSYGYEHHTQNINFGGDLENPDADWSFTLTCESDELEEWVYPNMTISKVDVDHDVSFTLTNETDPGTTNTMSINTARKDTFYIDCQNCIISEDSGLVNFRDLGWNDVGNIYWLRLKPGENTITVNGVINLQIDYDSPVKYVGGWLI